MATIAQNISRIQTAKADLKTAIEAKGVTVPSATTIDGYATLVGQIQTGGGGGTDYSQQYLTFRNTDGGDISCYFTRNGFGGQSGDLYWSSDGGTTWNQYGFSYHEEIGGSGCTEVILKGDLTNYDIIGDMYNPEGIGTFTFNYVSSNRITIEGNIMSLLAGDNFVGEDDLTTYSTSHLFIDLFHDNANARFIIYADNLILPAMTLIPHCYAYMFSNCEKLMTAPELPAIYEVTDCYDHMFAYCYNLRHIKMLLKTSIYNSTNYWLEGLDNVFNNGYLVGIMELNQNNGYIQTGTSGVPQNWERIDVYVPTPNA